MHKLATPIFRLSFQCTDQGTYNSGSAGTNRMTQSTRAAVNIHFVCRQVQVSHCSHGHHSKCFVDFKQINLCGVQADFFKQPL